MHTGTLLGSFSQSCPSITFACTFSIMPWHAWHMPAMLSRWMLLRGSLWLRTLWAVWQSEQTADFVRPRLYRPSPWIENE